MPKFWYWYVPVGTCALCVCICIFFLTEQGHLELRDVPPPKFNKLLWNMIQGVWGVLLFLLPWLFSKIETSHLQPCGGKGMDQGCSIPVSGKPQQFYNSFPVHTITLEHNMDLKFQQTWCIWLVNDKQVAPRNGVTQVALILSDSSQNLENT